MLQHQAGPCSAWQNEPPPFHRPQVSLPNRDSREWPLPQRHSPHPNTSQASEAPGSSTPLERDMHPLKSHLSSAITGVTSTAFKKCQRASIRQINLLDSPKHSTTTVKKQPEEHSFLFKNMSRDLQHARKHDTTSPSERTRSSSIPQSMLAHTLAVSRVS